MSELYALLRHAFDNVLDSLYALVVPAVFFALLALAIKRGEAWAAARRAGEQVRVSLWLYFLDAVFTVPVMAIVISAIHALLFHLGVTRFQTSVWAMMGTYPTLFLVLFLGDFASYWRHRFEHTSFLWPSHAVHHSDTDMTWLTLERFHPINRVTTTVIDSTFLVLMGFPAWAVLANSVVRHYYGYFIHADLPWTYGKFGAIFVSPAMHHWHHAREVRYAGTNFATVFSVFDRAFGTYKGGLCDVPLGLDADMGVGVKGQLAYPFRVWWARLSKRREPGAGVVERPAAE
jgi:sterol desaturase/sphingolipid hydroxylase (fatty acid hydroxylase superfamily)